MSLTVWDRPEAERAAAGPPPATGDQPGSGGRNPRSRYRRRVVWAVVVLVLLLVVAVLLAIRGRGGNDDPLDPRNAGSDGTQAVARVLDERGVRVDIARDRDALDALLPLAEVWMHGHLHCPQDYVKNGCRIVANPLGYAKKDEQQDFAPDRLWEVASRT